MGGAERIVGALAALGETGKAPALAKRVDPVAPTGQDLVRVTLVSNIPDDFVVWCVKNVVQRNRQLHNTQRRSQVPTGRRNCIDCFCTQLFSNLIKLSHGPVLQVRWSVNAV